MNSLRNETIHKIFGTRLQGGLGLALTLLDRASMVNWEALWPQIQNAMIGLGVGAIAYLNREAIAKGLTELAQQIAAFQPTVSPMPGEALTRAEIMPLPYIPIAFPEIAKPIRESAIPWANEAVRESQIARADETKLMPPNCENLEEVFWRLIEARGKIATEAWPGGVPSGNFDALMNQDARTEDEIRALYKRMQALGCHPKTRAGNPIDTTQREWQFLFKG